MTSKSKRPPTRIYVTVDDDLVPNVARMTLDEAESDARADAHLFGDTRVYEYRLVDRMVRGFAPSGKNES